jgi:primosomal protein N'
LKKGGESVYKESIDNMLASRKEIVADRKELKGARWVQLKEMEERRMAAKERRVAIEEQRATIEERRVAVEEAAKMLEQEQRIMLMDPLSLDEKGRSYFEIMHDQVLASRSRLFMGVNGGFSTNGSSTDIGGGGGASE